MLVEQALCSRFRTPKSACTTCVERCPTAAIRIEDRGAEIAGTCQGCGVCFAVCPNGAFRITGKDDQTLLAAIRERSAMPPVTFRIRCARAEAPADLVVPCLGRVTEVLLLEPLRLGASATEIAEPPCEACAFACAVADVPKLLRRTRALSEFVGCGSDAIKRRRVPLRSRPEMDESPVTRRDFLRAMRGQTAGVSTASLTEDSSRNGEGRPSFWDLLEQHRDSPKRSLLLECLRGFPVRDAGSPAPLAEVLPPDALLAELSVTARCTGCRVCATLCPTGALTARWTEQEFVLGFRPWACTNCGVCAKVCGPRAIRARPSGRLDALLLEREVTLFKARKATCRRCRDAFPADGSEICPLCRHLERRRLAALDAVSKEHLS